MTTIRLSSPKQLGAALRSLMKSMDGASVQALRKTARWGATEVARVSAQTNPRPRATGTFERSWVVVKLVDGALLANSAKHSAIVEAGRRPGKQPPVLAIMEWMIAKRIDKRLSRGLGRDAQGKFKSIGRDQLRAIALRIARAIGRRGIRGRYVLRKTLPSLRKRLALEVQLEMQRAFQREATRRL